MKYLIAYFKGLPIAILRLITRKLEHKKAQILRFFTNHLKKNALSVSEAKGVYVSMLPNKEKDFKKTIALIAKVLEVLVSLVELYVLLTK